MSSVVGGLRTAGGTFISSQARCQGGQAAGQGVRYPGGQRRRWRPPRVRPLKARARTHCGAWPRVSPASRSALHEDRGLLEESRVYSMGAGVRAVRTILGQ